MPDGNLPDVKAEKRLDSETIDHAVNVLVHEMRIPIVVFRACVERMEHECRTKGYRFEHNYFVDLQTYTDVLRRLVQQFELLRDGASRITVQTRRVLLLKDVVAPAIRHIQPILLARRFPKNAIEYFGMHNLPPLFVDPALMTQVFFNLLENAVKYFLGPPTEFRIIIDALCTERNVEIRVSDFGVGIPPEALEGLFRTGFRAGNAERTAGGNGLGLWLSREVVRRHHGDLVLSHSHKPTTFSIRLPVSIKDQ